MQLRWLNTDSPRTFPLPATRQKIFLKPQTIFSKLLVSFNEQGIKKCLTPLPKNLSFMYSIYYNANFPVWNNQIRLSTMPYSKDLYLYWLFFFEQPALSFYAAVNKTKFSQLQTTGFGPILCLQIHAFEKSPSSHS